MTLTTLTPDANVVVAGANGGIGGEFVRQLVSNERIKQVFALTRDALPASDERVTPLRFDYSDETSIRDVAESVSAAGPVDAVIVATGLLHNDELQPEKTYREIDSSAMIQSFLVNSVGPVLMAKHFLPLLRRGSKSVFAAISARVGSITDNRLGGWASYRASKAALNMLLRTVSIEHKRRNAESIVVALHPGTVDTRLSAPFQKRVPEGKLFTPAYAVERLTAVIDSLDAGDTGRFFAWDGQPIDY